MAYPTCAARLRWLASVAAVLVLSVVPAFGQGQGVAELNGRAVDQTGLVLPGVTVTATEESTGLVRTIVSNDTGRFVMPALPPGRYTLKAELSGFQTQTRTGVQASVGQALTITFTLPVGSVTEDVTVTGGVPLVDVTQATVSTVVSQESIENLPMQGREQYALLALIPGLVPNISSGTMTGTLYNANGQDTGTNLFMVDGVYNNDASSMSSVGALARVTVDTMAEFQVLTHQFGAEWGGSSGTVVNSISKSGANAFFGDVSFYYEDDKLNGTNYFLKQQGLKNSDSGRRSFGGNIGGPIVRNKAFFFFNYEDLLSRSAQNVNIPAAAAPLAASYSTTTDITNNNYFMRVDYQATPKHHLSWRLLLEPNTEVRTGQESARRTLSAARYDAGSPFEFLTSGQWMAILNDRMVNEFKFSSLWEPRHAGDARLWGDKFGGELFANDGTPVGAGIGDELDFGSEQSHPDYIAGFNTDINTSHVKTPIILTNQLSYTPGAHSLKFGGGYTRDTGTRTANNNVFGSFQFGGNTPYNPADPSTYPIRFQMTLGNHFFEMHDWRVNFYVADKWQLNEKLSLNLGIRYEYQDLVPRTKDAFSPRLGFAYAPSEKTVIRGGIGKFYQHQSTRVVRNLQVGQLISQTILFDTGEDTSALSGRLPAHPCLRADGANGLAVISAACRAQLAATRDQVRAGVFVNPEPVFDGNRQMGYLLGFSAGIQHEILPGMAVTIDYVGNRGYDQTGRIDINEPRLLPDGRIARPGPSVFDPDGILVPASARGATFRRVLQYTTDPAFNSDHNALELSVQRRYANRWTGRMSYTLSRARDVNTTSAGANFVERRVNDDFNPRKDYGRTNFDTRHAWTSGANWDAWRGLGIGATVRFYSGQPINETVGLDVNRDNDNTDRPVRGVHDLTIPIASEVDADGMAIRNGIFGPNKLFTDLRVQYVHPSSGTRSVGFYWEIYNLLDRVNYGDPIGNRRSADFLKSVVAGPARSMQLGVRVKF